MAEHQLDEPVIGIAFDGTGLGTDGNIWGGEFLIADLNGFERFSHFEYLPLIGGDKVVKDPARIALAMLNKIGNDASVLLKSMDEKKLVLLKEAIDKQINIAHS